MTLTFHFAILCNIELWVDYGGGVSQEDWPTGTHMHSYTHTRQTHPRHTHYTTRVRYWIQRLHGSRIGNAPIESE